MLKSRLYDRFIDVSLSYDGNMNKPFKVPISSLKLPTKSALAKALKAQNIKELVTDKGRIEIITSRQSGVRPAIDVSIKELPGDAIYQMELTIHNWSLPRYMDVRKFTKMTVRMGYRNQIYREFVSPIFSASCTAPVPQQTYSFHGVVVGEQGLNLFNQDRDITVVLNEGTLTLKTLAEAIAKAIGDNMQVTFDGVPKALQEFPIMRQRTEYTAESAYAIVTWFAKQVSDFSQALADLPKEDGGLGYDPHLYAIITNDEIRVLGGILDDTKEDTDKVIQLDACKSLMYTGPKLTLTHLWVPNLEPGSIFSIPTNVYSDNPQAQVSGQLSDTLMGRVAGTTVGYFRAILVNVDFSTVGTTNQMTVEAMPLASESNREKDAEMREAETAAKKQKEAEEIEKQKEETVEVAVGTPEPSQDPMPKDFYTVPYTLSVSMVDDYKIEAGDSLSVIMQKYSGGRFKFGPADLANKDDWAKVNNKWALQYGEGFSLYYYFPIIMWATYNNTRPDLDYMWGKGDEIRSPDSISVGRYLRVPINLNPSSLKHNTQAAQVFKAAMAFYEEMGNKDYVSKFNDIIIYIEGAA